MPVNSQLTLDTNSVALTFNALGYYQLTANYSGASLMIESWGKNIGEDWQMGYANGNDDGLIIDAADQTVQNCLCLYSDYDYAKIVLYLIKDGTRSQFYEFMFTPDTDSLLTLIDGNEEALLEKYSPSNAKYVSENTKSVTVTQDQISNGSVTLTQGIADVNSWAADPSAWATTINLTCPEGTNVKIPYIATDEAGNPYIYPCVLIATVNNGEYSVIRNSITDPDYIYFKMPSDQETLTIRYTAFENTYDIGDLSQWFNADCTSYYAMGHYMIYGIPTDIGYVFAGNNTVTRAMFATILHRVLNEPEVTAQSIFSDVSSSDYFAESSTWAYNAGVITGYPDGTFGGNNNITREEMATMIMRFAATLGMDTSARANLSAYTDASELTFGQEAMSWCVAEGLIKGYGGSNTLGGSKTATRAEAAAIIKRLITLELGA
jgi:hypothetical protein